MHSAEFARACCTSEPYSSSEKISDSLHDQSWSTPPPPSHHHHINTAYCVFTPTVYTLFKTSYNFISRSHPIHHLIIYTLLGTLFSPDPSLLQLIFDLPCISNAATAINTGILKRTEASSSEILYYFSCNLPTLVLSTCNNQYIRP